MLTSEGDGNAVLPWINIISERVKTNTFEYCGKFQLRFAVLETALPPGAVYDRVHA